MIELPVLLYEYEDEDSKKGARPFTNNIINSLVDEKRLARGRSLLPDPARVSHNNIPKHKLIIADDGRFAALGR